MRYVKFAVLAAITICLVFLALANRQNVELSLVPEAFVGLIGFNATLTVPLFVVIFAGVLIGLLIGFIWEWLREMKLRSYGRKEHKRVVKLEREVTRLKTEKHQGKDDVLALLEK
ncbi:MAG: lipopolysaccharide assembly protein LapA domain-containing protein [Planktomarina sp.]